MPVPHKKRPPGLGGRSDHVFSDEMCIRDSMNCLCEAIGIGLPGNGTIPAVYSKRLQLGRREMCIRDSFQRIAGWCKATSVGSGEIILE